jgi:hypothetical protein
MEQEKEVAQLRAENQALREALSPALTRIEELEKQNQRMRGESIFSSLYFLCGIPIHGTRSDGYSSSRGSIFWKYSCLLMAGSRRSMMPQLEEDPA